MGNEFLSFVQGLLEGFADNKVRAEDRQRKRGASVKAYLQKTELPRLQKEKEALTPKDKEAQQRLDKLIAEYQKILTMPDEKVPEYFANLKLPTGEEDVSVETLMDSTKTMRKKETPAEAETAVLDELGITNKKLALAASFIPDLSAIAMSGRDTKGRRYDDQTRQQAAELLKEIQSGQFNVNDLTKFNPIIGFDIEQFTSLSPTEQARRIVDAGWGTVDEDGKLQLTDSAPVGLANAIKSGAIVPDFKTQKFQRLAQSEEYKKLQLGNSQLAAQIEALGAQEDLTQAQVEKIKADIDREKTLLPEEKARLKAQVDNLIANTQVQEAEASNIAAKTVSVQLHNKHDEAVLDSEIQRDVALNKDAIKQSGFKTLTIESQSKLAGLQYELANATFDSTVQEAAARSLAAQIEAYQKQQLSPWTLASSIYDKALTLPKSYIDSIPDELLRKLGIPRKMLEDATQLGAYIRNNKFSQAAFGIINQAAQYAPKPEDQDHALKAVDEQLQNLGITDPNLRQGMLDILKGAWNKIATDSHNAALRTAAYVASLQASLANKDGSNTPSSGGLGFKDVNNILNSLIDNESKAVDQAQNYLIQQRCAVKVGPTVKYYMDHIPSTPDYAGQTCSDLIQQYRDKYASYQSLVGLQKQIVAAALGIVPGKVEQVTPSTPQTPTTQPTQPAQTQPQGKKFGSVDDLLAQFKTVPDRLGAQNAIKRIQEWSSSAGENAQVPKWVSNLIVGLAKQTGSSPAEVAQAILGGANAH